MRMNTSRIVHDEEDEEYIRRPMSSLMTSSTPMASSNISIITSSDLSTGQNKNKNQSLPKAQDFPALSSTNTTSNPGRSVPIDFFGLILIEFFSSIRCLDSCWKYFTRKIIGNTTEKEI